MARISSAVFCSHVPAIGAAIDNKRTEEPYWQRVFSGYEESKKWIAEVKPDVCIVVFNDHATAFSVDIVPTFALGCGQTTGSRGTLLSGRAVKDAAEKLKAATRTTGPRLMAAQ